MPNSSNLSFLGIGKETVPGTAVAATAYIPVSAPTGKDNVHLLDDKGMRGSMVDVYDQIAGVKSATFDFGGDVFPDTFGWLAAGILGDVATTGASAPFTHAMAALNSGQGQPTSYTLSDYYAINTRQYAGAKINDLAVKFAGDSMLTYAAKTITFGSVVTTKPTTSFTTVQPLAGWVGSVTLGGTAFASLLSGEVNIKRAAEPLFPVNGSQNPSSIWCGPVTVDGKMSVIMEDDVQLAAYLNTTSTSLVVNYSQGTGAGAVQVQFAMSKVKYSLAEITRGKNYVELAITFTGLANTTDIGVSAGYSPIKVTIKNAVASGTYV